MLARKMNKRGGFHSRGAAGIARQGKDRISGSVGGDDEVSNGGGQQMAWWWSP